MTNISWKLAETKLLLLNDLEYYKKEKNKSGIKKAKKYLKLIDKLIKGLYDKE